MKEKQHETNEKLALRGSLATRETPELNSAVVHTSHCTASAHFYSHFFARCLLMSKWSIGPIFSIQHKTPSARLESPTRTDETPFSSLSTAFVQPRIHKQLLCRIVDIKYAKCFLGTDQFYECESQPTGVEAVQHRSAACGSCIIYYMIIYNFNPKIIIISRLLHEFLWNVVSTNMRFAC